MTGHKYRCCLFPTASVSRLLTASVWGAGGGKSKLGLTLHPMPPTCWKATPLHLHFWFFPLHWPHGQVCIMRSSGTNPFSSLTSWRFWLAGCQELPISWPSLRWDPRFLVPSGFSYFLHWGHWPSSGVILKPALPCWSGRLASSFPHLESAHWAMARMKIPEAFLGCWCPTHHLAGHLGEAIRMETWDHKMFLLKLNSSSWL